MDHTQFKGVWVWTIHSTQVYVCEQQIIQVSGCGRHPVTSVRVCERHPVHRSLGVWSTQYCTKVSQCVDDTYYTYLWVWTTRSIQYTRCVRNIVHRSLGVMTTHSTQNYGCGRKCTQVRGCVNDTVHKSRGVLDTVYRSLCLDDAQSTNLWVLTTHSIQMSGCGRCSTLVFVCVDDTQYTGLVV